MQQPTFSAPSNIWKATQITPDSLVTRSCHGSVVLCVSENEAMSVLDEVIQSVKLAAPLWEYHLENNLMFF